MMSDTEKLKIANLFIKQQQKIIELLYKKFDDLTFENNLIKGYNLSNIEIDELKKIELYDILKVEIKRINELNKNINKNPKRKVKYLNNFKSDLLEYQKT
jgi:hypothetical protein